MTKPCGRFLDLGIGEFCQEGKLCDKCNLFDEAIAALRRIDASGICRYDPDLWQPMSAVLRKVDHPEAKK